MGNEKHRKWCVWEREREREREKPTNLQGEAAEEKREKKCCVGVGEHVYATYHTLISTHQKDKDKRLRSYHI